MSSPAKPSTPMPPADEWNMAETAPPPPPNGQQDVVHIPSTKGWKVTGDFPKSGFATSPEGVQYVKVKTEDQAHVIVDAKTGPLYLRRKEDPPPAEEPKAKGGKKKAAAPKAPKAPKAESPGKGKGHGGRAKGERFDYATISDKDLKAWAEKRQPWFMTRARQIELQGVKGFRERVAKLMAVGIPAPRSKSKAEKEAVKTTAPAPKPVSKAEAKREAAKAEKKARKA